MNTCTTTAAEYNDIFFSMEADTQSGAILFCCRNTTHFSILILMNYIVTFDITTGVSDTQVAMYFMTKFKW